MPVISDNFERANAANLGANWQALNGVTQLVDGQAWETTAGQFSFVRHVTAVGADDTYAQVAPGSIIPVSAHEKALYVFTRANAATTLIPGLTAYMAYVSYTTAPSVSNWGIAAYLAGTFNYIGGGFGALGHDITTADVCRLEVFGSWVRLFVAGVKVQEFVDTSISASNGSYAGFGVVAPNTNYQISGNNFEAGPIEGRRSRMMAV